MPTIADQLSALDAQRDALAANLVAKGVAATSSEKLNTLVPKVLDIPTGIDTSDATATASDVLAGKTAYADDEKIIGSIPVKVAETYTPTTTDQVITGGQYLSGNQVVLGDADLVSGNIAKGASIFGVTGDDNVVNTSDGTVTAQSLPNDMIAYSQGSRVVGAAPRIHGEVFTPGIEAVSLPHGFYDYSNIVIGDADLVPENIKSGVTLFNVPGTYAGIDTSDATATAGKLLLGETAYVDGEKITGTIQNLPEQYQVIAPGTEAIVVYPGYYIDQGLAVAGDPALVSENIKADSNIFGVAGDPNVIDTTETTSPASNANLLTGHVAFVNGLKITGTLPYLNATTYTPSTVNQVIAAQQFLRGNQTILGDTNLIASNIKLGVNLFGVTGTYSGGGLLTKTTLFINSEDAVETYRPIIYMDNTGTGGGLAEPLTSLAGLVAKDSRYEALLSSETNNEFRISTTALGWGSTQHVVNLTPINFTGEGILWFLMKVSTGDSKNAVVKFVQASGTGDELAANILANASIEGSYIDASEYVPYTNRTYIEMIFRTDISAYTGNYYLYIETTSDNSSPYFQELSVTVEH